jgi:hypothetical protein
VTAADRRFYGILLLAFGSLFILGGWLAAFTPVGAFLIFAGSAMLIAAPLVLWSHRPVPLAFALLAAGWGWPWMLTL